MATEVVLDLAPARIFRVCRCFWKKPQALTVLSANIEGSYVYLQLMKHYLCIVIRSSLQGLQPLVQSPTLPCKLLLDDPPSSHAAASGPRCQLGLQW